MNTDYNAPTPPTDKQEALQGLPPLPTTHDYSAPLRVWHWGSALLVSGSLLTILFLKVIVSPRDLIPEWKQALAKDGVAMTVQQGRALAHAVGERIWDWHIAIGLTLAGFWLLP